MGSERLIDTAALLRLSWKAPYRALADREPRRDDRVARAPLHRRPKWQRTMRRSIPVRQRAARPDLAS